MTATNIIPGSDPEFSLFLIVTQVHNLFWTQESYLVQPIDRRSLIVFSKTGLIYRNSFISRQMIWVVDSTQLKFQEMFKKWHFRNAGANYIDSWKYFKMLYFKHNSFLGKNLMTLETINIIIQTNTAGQHMINSLCNHKKKSILVILNTHTFITIP